jgi:hypothetical protein
MGQQIALLMHGAALDRNIGPQRRQRLLQAGRAVDDDEFRRLQAAFDQIVEQRPPGRLSLAAHLLCRVAGNRATAFQYFQLVTTA